MSGGGQGYGQQYGGMGGGASPYGYQGYGSGGGYGGGGLGGGGGMYGGQYNPQSYGGGIQSQQGTLQSGPSAAGSAAFTGYNIPANGIQPQSWGQGNYLPAGGIQGLSQGSTWNNGMYGGQYNPQGMYGGSPVMEKSSFYTPPPTNAPDQTRPTLAPRGSTPYVPQVPSTPTQVASTGYPPMPPTQVASTPTPPQISWRNMSPGQRADAQRAGMGPQSTPPAYGTTGAQPAYGTTGTQPGIQNKALGGQQSMDGQPFGQTTLKDDTGNGYGYGTPGGYQFDTAQSTLDPNSMNFLLNWMGGTVNGQNPQQQSQQYLDTYRQRYPQGVPGVNNPTTPWTNYLIGQRF